MKNHGLNIYLLHDLPVYDGLSIKQISKAAKRYARSYKVDIKDSKDPLDFFKDLLDEIEGFKYQITVKVLLSKHKENGALGFPPVYFNFKIKIVINFE